MKDSGIKQVAERKEDKGECGMGERRDSLLISPS
jgi:hypothetical protein